MEKLLVERKNYLNHLLQAKDKHIIKVITGVRRCGKSTLLAQFQQILLSQGVHEEQILSIHLDWIESEPLLEYHALYDHIKG
ncbi:MAG: AAA family ATPase, partial [Selenomonadaceae bacterium]|nr:AAA family ATPase [Selenomonadaceae bacterium]